MLAGGRLLGRRVPTPFSRLRWTRHWKQMSVGSEFGLQPTSSDTNPLNLEMEGVRGKGSRGADLRARIRMSIPFRARPIPARSPIHPPQLTLNRTGNDFGVRSETPSCHSGAVFSSRSSGSRSRAWKAICPSMRARGAPRQWWTP